LKNWKKKIFCEIRAKKIHSKMGNAKKGTTQQKTAKAVALKRRAYYPKLISAYNVLPSVFIQDTKQKVY